MANIDKKALEEKIAEKKLELQNLKTKRDMILKTGQSYSLKDGDNSRSLTQVSYEKICKQITNLEREVASLENQAKGLLPSRCFVVGSGWGY